ncbi:hypothetical protein QMK33_15150 [Hymenobacter sp. H14-R3]|uniref:hypothetical protein n=1 Tax=Hymenobacter sp. H14-R3 TaxID=3046308 RepID=UPI0024BB368C|nr:hypothetical protein [Hymenobacter sp. H14-R3]MDJ0366495.1 hypothetical protein [Hymenobacter sp. H14-R3]
MAPAGCEWPCAKRATRWPYLCAYQDMASKQVLGWPVGASMPEVLLTSALQRAFWAQPPTPGLLVHADRGGQ